MGKAAARNRKLRKRAQKRIWVLRNKINQNAKPRAIESLAKAIMKEADKVKRLDRQVDRSEDKFFYSKKHQ
jgi:hypothetical protein